MTVKRILEIPRHHVLPNLPIGLMETKYYSFIVPQYQNSYTKFHTKQLHILHVEKKWSSCERHSLSFLSFNEIGSQVLPFQRISKFRYPQFSFPFGWIVVKKMILLCHSMNYHACDFSSKLGQNYFLQLARQNPITVEWRNFSSLSKIES